ncbi:MAG: phosphoribosyltransferase [Vulcanisaeta sp. AZ3]|jgi:hypoxanthine phosphoribosyltransferase
MVSYHRYGWEDIERGTLKLVQDILRDHYQPDIIIGISKGGVIIASLISDMLSVPVDLMRIAHWGFGRANNDATIRYRPVINVDGLNVLLVDDVADTGITLKIAKDELIRLGARNVKTAVLDYKALSSKFAPNYYVYMWTTWAYIIYPWENLEAFRNLNTNEASIVFTNQEVLKMRELIKTNKAIN